MELNVKFLFSNPKKAHPCAEPRTSFDNLFSVKIGSGAEAVGRWKNPEKRSRVNILMRNFAHTGKINPLRDRD